MERQNMTPGPPFAEMLRWKHRLGWGLIAAGLLVLAGTAVLGGEIFNGADLMIGMLGVGAIAWGFILASAPDPARL